MSHKPASHNDSFSPRQDFEYAIGQGMVLASVVFVVLLLLATGVLSW